VPKIRIIVVERTKAPFLGEGERFYLKRLTRYVSVEWVEVKGRRISEGSSRKEILDREAEALSARIGANDHLIALCEQGSSLNSKSFARRLEKLCREKIPVTFVIGGPLGLGSAVYHRSSETLSLSSFTLTHEMSRIILLEQLYRAFTIMRNEKYHK
jgi:23S rRNA (pseudouridine1915-N3)-methyltransferase